VVRATNTHNDQGNPCCVLEYHASFNYHSPIYPNGPPSSPSAGSIAMAMALNSHRNGVCRGSRHEFYVANGSASGGAHELQYTELEVS
jgi:hypothetical protein